MVLVFAFFCWENAFSEYENNESLYDHKQDSYVGTNKITVHY